MIRIPLPFHYALASAVVQHLTPPQPCYGVLVTMSADGKVDIDCLGESDQTTLADLLRKAIVDLSYSVRPSA